MKITFACIVLNGDYVLQPLLESIYPFAHKIIFIDGAVKYWHDRGVKGSADKTVNIIKEFKDPYHKIILHEKQTALEKTELCQLFMKDIPEDTDYLFCIDSDEIFKHADLEKIKHFLITQRPDTLGFQSNTFFGGFDHILTGFEKEHSFRRVLKYQPGCTYTNHRPPTLSCTGTKHVNGLELYEKTGVEMYHYSYVFPKQVYEKIQYYEAAVISKGNCIQNYFHDVYLKWLRNPELRNQIEKDYRGVHEFSPAYRGDCYTQEFMGVHPYPIQKNIGALRKKVQEQTARQWN